MRRRLFWVHAAILGGFILLTLLLTWPLVGFFATHVPGDGIDDPSLAWNLWWIQHRLVDQLNFDIFHVDAMFFPIEINLAFYTLTPLNGFLSIPVQNAFSLILASNVMLMATYVLGGYGVYLLVREILVIGDWGLGTGDQGLGTRGKGQGTGERSHAANTGATTTATRGDWILSNRSPVPSPQSLIPLFSAIIYAFASSKLFYAALGQFNIASSHWVPFAVLYTVRTARTGRGRDALLAGLFVTFQAWSELTYASFLLIFIGIYFLWQLVASTVGGSTRGWPRALGLSLRRQLPPFLLMGAVTLAGLLPFLWAMAADLLTEGDFFGSGGGFADIFSADLMGYLWPTRLHPFLGAWAAQLPFPNDKGQQIYIGYTALILAVAGGVWIVRRLGWRGLLWPLLTLWFGWLTLGAEARWGGESTGIPGPFALISQLPFFSGNRYPSRYSVMLMLCVAVLVGFALQSLRNLMNNESRMGRVRWRRRTFPILYSLFIGLFLFEHLSIPLPLNDSRVPSIYREIGAEDGDFTLLELPTGWRNGARVMGRSDVLIMMQQWYQAVHEKRRLGGNTSRNPDYKFQYFAEAPLLGDLIRLMNADAQIDGRAYLSPVIEAEWDELVARNRSVAPWVLDFLDVQEITLHMEKSPPQLVRFVEEALPVSLVGEWQGTDWSGDPSTIRRYRVSPVDGDGLWAVDAGSALGQLTAAEGWSAGGVDGRLRYALREEVDLLLDLPSNGATLTLELYGPAALRGLSIQGQNLDWATLPGGGEPRVVTVNVPPALADAAVDRLRLRFDGLYPLADLSAPGDGWLVGSTAVRLPLARPIYVRSAGKDAGDFAYVFVAGQQVAQNQLGYNLVALDSNGEVLESVVFNTLISPAESANMAAWIASWPVGTVIAGAVRDEASYNLGQEAVDALRAVGVVTDLRGAFRGSHAFIAVVGAPEGSAAESFTAWGVAEVAAGPPIDGALVSGGVGAITVE